MPFPPPPLESIGTPAFQLDFYSGADVHADWDNIGFRVREGAPNHAMFQEAKSDSDTFPQSTVTLSLITASKQANGAPPSSSKIPTCVYMAWHLV